MKTKIRSVEAIRIRQLEFDPQEGWTTSPTDALYDFGDEARRSPMGVYNTVIANRTDPVFTVIVRVTTDEGISGVGGIALGSEAVAQFVEHNLRPLVLGCSPFDTELLWEKMFRSTVNVGRNGLALEAISGIHIALWDAIGKALGDHVDLMGDAYVGWDVPYAIQIVRMREPFGSARHGVSKGISTGGRPSRASEATSPDTLAATLQPRSH
jgi:hypothetical protein